MFTGITQGLFSVKSLTQQANLLHYSVILNAALVKDLTIGASVAIDGVCQTVVAMNGFEVSFDAIPETLAKTTLCDLFVNRKVSVERSLRFGDEVGGHEVSGHVLEAGVVLSHKTSDYQVCLTIQCSETCFSFIKPKGFIAVDGSSLTVGLTNKNQLSFEVYLTPETLRRTHFANKIVGDRVNLEPDMKTMILVKAVQDYFPTLQNRLEKIEKKLEQLIDS